MVATNILKPSLPNINMVTNTCGLDSCFLGGKSMKKPGRVDYRTPISTAIWSNEIATSHGSLSPQKVAFWKRNPLISGKSRLVKYYLGSGFKYVLCSTLPGEMIHFD